MPLAPDKYQYIDLGITLVNRTGTFTNVTGLFTSPVSNITVTPNVSWNGVSNITRLMVAWDSNATNYSDKYTLIWSNLAGTSVTVTDLLTPSFDILNPIASIYTITVIAINSVTDVQATPVTISYSYKVGSSVSDLLPPINPRITGTAALLITSTVISVTWDYNPTNDSVVDKIFDYVIEVYDEVPASLLGTFSTTPNGSNGGSFEASYANIYDVFGALPRKFTLRIYSRDTNGDRSITYLEFTLNNPVPAATDFTLEALEKQVKVSINVPADSDGIGFNIYTSLTSGGTRTLVHSGAERSAIIPAPEVPAILKYYTVDTFDMLGTTGLATSFEHSITAAATTAKASDIAVTPVGTISSTNVQAALAELDSEKEAISNKVVAWSSPTDVQYPSAKLVSDSLALKLDASSYHLYYRGKFTTLSALTTAIPVGIPGEYAQVDVGAGNNVVNYNWDDEEGWVVGSSGGGATNTDTLPEGSTNLYFTESRVRSTLLTGFSALAGTIGATDSILVAFNKLVGNLALKLTANTAITSATKTKITYDTNGLVTSGTDATTADIADSTDKRYQTDNQQSFNDATSSIQTQLNTKQATFGSQTANFFYAAPNGSSGNPTFRAIVSADIPILNQNTTGSAAKLTTARTINGVSFDGTADITVIAEATHAATSKTTPVDADLIGIVDSAASNVLKSLSWANLKATLKTYFDTIYPVNGAWTTWTPTFTNLTVGNGTLSAKYKQIGDKTYSVAVQVTLGSTSSVGTSPSFSIPFTLTNTSARCIGSGSVYDTSAAAMFKTCLQVKSSTEFYFGLNYVTGTNVGVRGLTATIPMTFATGDIIYVEGTIEIA